MRTTCRVRDEAETVDRGQTLINPVVPGVALVTATRVENASTMAARRELESSKTPLDECVVSRHRRLRPIHAPHHLRRHALIPIGVRLPPPATLQVQVYLAGDAVVADVLQR